MNKVLIGIQARNKSTRFPDKIHKDFNGKTILENILQTAKAVNVKDVECIVKVISSVEDPVFKNDGDYYVVDTKADDLVSRYTKAMEHFECDGVVRITADCPLIPQGLIEIMIDNLKRYDYATNVLARTFPDGYDCQAIQKNAMHWIDLNQTKNREHPFYDLELNYEFRLEFEKLFTITSVIDSNRLIVNPYLPTNKLSVDTPEDLERIKKLWTSLYSSPNSSLSV